MKLRSALSKNQLLVGCLISLLIFPAFGQTDGGNYVEEEFVNYRVSEDPLNRLAPYRERRQSTGGLFSIAYCQFRPLDYVPNFTAPGVDFDTVYGGDSTQMVELSFLYKLNLFFGSLSFGLGVGYQKLESDLAFGDSYLSLVPVRLEGMLALDILFENPSIVPFAVGGVYSVYYSEEQAASVFAGTTQAAPYFGGGAAFRLDSFFPNESFNAYKENFQENTFVYLEVRKWLSSNHVQDPDFSTDFQYGAGIRFEF